MRLHINIGDATAAEIDRVAGPRGRSQYIRDAIEARLEVDRRLVARRQLIGSAPDFAPWMTADWISENRAREDREREQRLARQQGEE